MDARGVPLVVPVAEGDGEVEALPLLMRRILHERLERYDARIAPAKNAGGRGSLTRPGGVERFVRYARIEGASAVLLLLDGEGDPACVLACDLQARIAALNPPFPVAVVCADRQYESWFVESAASLAGRWGLPDDLCPPASPVTNPKRWPSEQMPPGRIYKETTHQEEMTAHMDLGVVEATSRSFQRLVHAVEELLDAMDAGECPVTPLRCPED